MVRVRGSEAGDVRGWPVRGWAYGRRALYVGHFACGDGEDGTGGEGEREASG